MKPVDLFSQPEPAIRRVYAYVAYRVGDGPDAEDITSDTFERAFRYRNRFDPRRGEPLAWLIGIARRQIAEHLERRAAASGSVPDRAAPGELADDSAQKLDLRDAVRLLNDRDRELVALRYGADLTARQIGELLEMKTNAVEVALHRALQTLREALAVPAHGDQPRRPDAQSLRTQQQ